MSGAARVFAFGEDTLSLCLACKLAELRSGYADRFCAFGTEPDPKYRVATQDNPIKKNAPTNVLWEPHKKPKPRRFPFGVAQRPEGVKKQLITVFPRG